MAPGQTFVVLAAEGLATALLAWRARAGAASVQYSTEQHRTQCRNLPHFLLQGCLWQSRIFLHFNSHVNVRAHCTYIAELSSALTEQRGLYLLRLAAAPAPFGHHLQAGGAVAAVAALHAVVALAAKQLAAGVATGGRGGRAGQPH